MYYVIRINKGISMHSIHSARLVITLGLCPLVLAVKLLKNSSKLRKDRRKRRRKLFLRILYNYLQITYLAQPEEHAESCQLL